MSVYRIKITKEQGRKNPRVPRGREDSPNNDEKGTR